jgi:hypothetical protein
MLSTGEGGYSIDRMTGSINNIMRSTIGEQLDVMSNHIAKTADDEVV